MMNIQYNSRPQHVNLKALIQPKSGVTPSALPLTNTTLSRGEADALHFLFWGVIVLVVKFTVTGYMEINFMENITISKP